MLFCQQGWCDIPGTVEEVKAKLNVRQEGAIKRDRTMTYSNSTQVIEFKISTIFVMSLNTNK